MTSQVAGLIEMLGSVQACKDLIISSDGHLGHRSAGHGDALVECNLGGVVENGVASSRGQGGSHVCQELMMVIMRIQVTMLLEKGIPDEISRRVGGLRRGVKKGRRKKGADYLERC